MKKQIKKHTKAMWAAGFVVLLASMFTVFSSFEKQTDEWKAPPEADKVKNPFSGKETPQAKELYMKNCTQCHGTKGKGDGPKSEEIDKAPTDISTAAFNEQSDGSIFWKMTNGKKPMPSFKLDLTDDQRWQLVNYLRELKK